MSSTSSSQVRAPYAALEAARTWLNSEPLDAAALRGHVVVVQFWTFSCVNWLRTLPYVRAWHERYRDRGVVVVGVHSPEFRFEHEVADVRRATEALNVPYPVVLDSDFAIWSAFANRYWPALYLCDGDGRLRFEHFGEGAYAESERALQVLLNTQEEPVSVEAHGLFEAADWATVRSPETYLGSARGDRRADRPASKLSLNRWALDGAWSVGEEAAVLEQAPGTIAYRFEARDLNLVMAPPASRSPVRFTVRLDDAEPGDVACGVDVSPSGEGVLDEPRMYQLVRQRDGVAPRTFEITFDEPGARAYVFTFG